MLSVPPAISVQDLNNKLQSLKGGEEPDFVILDVRKEWELEICALPHCLHIPLDEINDNLDIIPKDKEVIVACHHGSRSKVGAIILLNAPQPHNFQKVYNLTGGIHQWAMQIDISMATY